MKTPTAASLKRVTAENLTNLGAERLAQILVAAADSRPDLKRRLRMELAAEQGADHLAVEIDKRLASLDTSRSKVSWRKRASFVGDLDTLRALIADRLAGLDRAAGLDRMWLFMDLARRLGVRVRDRDGALAAVFDRAADDVGRLISGRDAAQAPALVEAIVRDPTRWIDWLPRFTTRVPGPLLAETLELVQPRQGSLPGWADLVRLLADAVGDVDAFRSTYSENALRAPSAAAEVARRLLAADRIEEAGRLLDDARAAAPKLRILGRQGDADEPDFDWETVWLDYLERSGRAEAAQVARWSSFERTLSAERARAFTRRLTDFQDVEAEGRAFEYAASHPDFQRGLAFLMDWPALPEAARMIEARGDEVKVGAEQAELWAGRLRARQPAAAHTLLRKAAAAAFRRRDFATCDRLTLAADALNGS